MRIAALSDMHWKLPLPAEIPVCDILLIAGDGGDTALLRDWLEVVNERVGVVVGIAGNHDFNDRQPHLRELPWVYLEDSSYEYELGLKIYGSPWTKPFLSWSFMLPESDLSAKWDAIPDDTNILITHGPPYGVCDFVERPLPGNRSWEGEHVGSKSLLGRVLQLELLQLHVFGHIHEYGGRGGEYETGARWQNVSILDGEYNRWGPAATEIQLDERRTHGHNDNPG